MKRVFIYIILPLLATACYDSDLVFEDQYEPVVEAYVYKNKTVSDVYLSTMYSFGSDTTLGGQDITDAFVSLRVKNDYYELEHDAETPGRYTLSEEISLEEGDSLFLSVRIDELELNSTTVMPDDPPELNMSATTMEIEKVSDPREFMSIDQPDPIEISWDNPDGDYFFIRVQNIEDYSSSIMPDPPAGMEGRGRGGMVFQMDTEPTNSDYYSMSMRELTDFGTHEIIIYSINYEYVALYNSADQDSRELNEPYTNIQGGLGIFTAFNSDTVYLEVEPI